MKKNMNDLVEVCRGILRYNLDGYAEKDLYSEVYGEPSTIELKRRLRIIEEFFNGDLEDDGARVATLHILDKLKEKISDRE